MRCTWFGSALIALAQLSAPVHAQAPDDSLKIYAVTVVRTPPLRGQVTGDGIYLGNGLVITAAHVVGRWPFFNPPTGANRRTGSSCQGYQGRLVSK